MMNVPSILASLALASLTLAQVTTTQLFNFSTYVDIENSHLRPNGNLIFSTFQDGQLYTLDPYSSDTEAELVAAFPGVTALCGIATIGYDKFAIIGGIRGSYNYTNETIFTVDFSLNSTDPLIEVAAHVPDAILLNGMDSLPAYPHVVIAADSRVGALFRIDTDTGVSTIAFQNEALNAPTNTTVPIGINGLKIRGNFVYYTNTELFTFARIPMSDDGYTFGDIEIMDYMSASDIDGGYDWDDFVFDVNGTAFLAQPNNAIARITPDGQQEIVVGGGNSTTIIGPTSLTVGLDGKTVYVTSRGGTVGGYLYSGQVVEVKGLIP